MEGYQNALGINVGRHPQYQKNIW